MHELTHDNLKKFLSNRLKALDEWNFNGDTTIEEISGKAAAEAFGRFWELVTVADHFGIKLKELREEGK